MNLKSTDDIWQVASDQHQRIAELEAEIEQAQEWVKERNQAFEAKFAESACRIDRLEAENQQLRQALEPFTRLNLTRTEPGYRLVPAAHAALAASKAMPTGRQAPEEEADDANGC